MNKKLRIGPVGLAAVFVLIFAVGSGVFAQGRGNGGGKGNGKGSMNKSKKSDDSLWGGITDGKNKNKRSSVKGKSNRFKGLSKKTGLAPGVLESRYELERRLNPDLTYGQFVAAHMISKNHRGVSTSDILGGLRDGRSIGQTLKNKGWDRGKIDRERRRIRDESRDDDDYDDRDDWWRLIF
jgi:hypothetical protein